MRLEDLERELRAERPEVDPDFAHRLDEWAAAGFPRGGSVDPLPENAGRERGGFQAPLRRLGERLAAVPPRRILAPAAAAAILIVVVGVAVSQVDLGDGDDEQVAGPAILEERAPTERDSDAEDAAGAAAAPSAVAPAIPPDGGGEAIARGTEDRLQDKTARLSLGADADEVQGVANGVVEATDRHDGIVLDSQVTSDQGGARASFQLEIPFTELDAALTDLSELGDVISRTEASEDTTQAFIRAQRRHAATLERIEELRVQLIEADTRDERLVLKSQIAALKARADAHEAQRDRVAREARFASVAVEITSNGPAAGDEDGWTLGDAVGDAGDVLRTLAGIGLVSLAILVPVGLVASLAVWAVAAASRRNRERALD